MLKYLLIITLFNVTIICGDKNDDDAFVNSLPQEQKKEFLKKVEERIEREVREPKFPIGNDTNIDLFEQRLYDQGKLVKDIVRAEIENLKRRNNDQLSVKSNNKEFNDNNEHDRIDLTLRSSKSEENATTIQTESNRTQIPVTVMYDENNSKGKRDVKDMSSEIHENVTLTSNKSTEVNNSVARRSGNSDTASVDNKESAYDNANDSVVAVANTSTNSTDATSHDKVLSTLQDNVTIYISTKPNDDNSTIEAVTTEYNNNEKNRDDGTTQGNITDTTDAIGTTTISYADTSREGISSTISYENPKGNSKSSQQEVHVSSSPITKQHYTTSKSSYTKSTNEVDSTTESNASVSTTGHYLITTPYTVNNSKTPDTTTKNYNDATTIQYRTTLQRDDVNYTKGPNKQTNDPSKEDNEKSEEENENQPLFVPIHNYNPENAYFNTFNNQGPNGNSTKQIISQNSSTTIKKIETRSKSKTADIHSLFISTTNKTNLRIDDIKENASPSTASSAEIEINADDIMSSSEIRHLFNSKTKSVNMQSRDEIPDEKPLKHSLKKIREILFQHNIHFDKLEDDDRSVSDNSPKLEVGYGFPQKDRVITPTVQFNTFGSLLKNLVDHADETRYFKSKQKIDKDVIDSDNDDVYNSVIRSLKKHNEKLQNKDLYQTIKALENIQNRKEKMPLRNTISQTRFQVKLRDNRKPGPNSLEEDIRNLVHTYDKARNEKDKTNKSTTLKIPDKYLRSHANILRDLVEKNDVGLENYDWLTTTVNIQAAIAKLQDIIEKKRNHKIVHHLDHRLLKLVTNLYKSAIKTVIERENLDTPTRTHFHQPKKNKKFKFFGNKPGGKRSQYVDIEDFGRALDCLRNCLNDLHTAIKQIALITTYKNQHWFQNLKHLYLKSAEEKEYLEILLHLVAARLFGLLEDTATTIFAEDEDFLKKNRAEFDRIGVEFVMLIKICKGLMQLNG